MIELYSGGGSQEFHLVEDTFQADEWRQLSSRVHRWLLSYEYTEAARIFLELPFRLVNGTNGFDDDFTVLQALLPFDKYLDYRQYMENSGDRKPFEEIADAITALGPYVRFVVVDYDQTEGLQPVEEPAPRNASAAVEQSLADARHLMAVQGPLSAIDRVHTAFHGYLLNVCDEAGITVPDEAPITRIFKLLMNQHRSFISSGPFAGELGNIVRPLGAVVDACNHLRNRASRAHPNDPILSDAEAMLVINAMRTLFNYVQSVIESA